VSRMLKTCCCTYNMLKLTRHLFEWSPQARYADYYERALLNQILASQSPENGMVMYYIPSSRDILKYSAHLRILLVLHRNRNGKSRQIRRQHIFYDDNSLYVNLFIASELNWKEKGIVVRQQTNFPKRQKQALL